MSAEHTKGPWSLDMLEPGYYCIRHGEVGNRLPVYPYMEALGVSRERAQANLRRIVACVNACEGLATAAIEEDGLGWVTRSIGEVGGLAVGLHRLLIDARDALKTASEGGGIDFRAYVTDIDAGLKRAEPLVDAITDTTGPEWAERG